MSEVLFYTWWDGNSDNVDTLIKIVGSAVNRYITTPETTIKNYLENSWSIV